MNHLRIEHHLLKYIAQICGGKISGIYTHTCPQVTYPYAFLELEDVKGSMQSGVLSVSFCVHLFSRYQGSQEKTALVEHLRLSMEKPDQEEGVFRLIKQTQLKEKDNLTQKVTLSWVSRIPIPQS